MTSLLFLAAHMFGDYIAQNDWQAKNKMKNWWILAFHCSLYTLCFVPVLLIVTWHSHDLGLPGQQGGWFLGLIWITHFITDTRRWASPVPWSAKPILVDQTIHIVTLAILGVLFGLR